MEGGGTRDPSCGSWLFGRGAVCEGRPFLVEEDGVTGNRVMVATEPSGHVLRCTYPEEGPGVPGGMQGGSRLPSGLGRLAGGEAAGVPGQVASQTQPHPSAQVPFTYNVPRVPCHGSGSTESGDLCQEGSSGEAKEGPLGKDTVRTGPTGLVGNRPTGRGRAERS